MAGIQTSILSKGKVMKILNSGFPITIGDKVTFNPKIWLWYRACWGRCKSYYIFKELGTNDLTVSDIIKRNKETYIIHLKNNTNNEDLGGFKCDKNVICLDLGWEGFGQPYILRVK